MLSAELSDVGLFGSMPRYGDLAIHAVVDLRRRFGRGELERAVQATIADFPVLGCRYHPGFWRDRWVEVERPHGEMVQVLDEPADLEAETLRWVGRRIVSTHERPWRVVSLARGEGSRLILTLLHVAVDGGGAAAVGHVFGSHLYGVRPSLPVDERRELSHALERLRWYHLPFLARDMVGTVLGPLGILAAGRRARPYPQGPSPAQGDRGPRWRHLVLTASQVDALKARCRPAGASINDVLIAALARTVKARSDRGAATVIYTMDLRRYGAAARLTATNTSSILTALVPRRAIGDLASTAAAVARITARQRRRLVGPAYVLTAILLTAGSPHGLVRRLVVGIHPALVDLPLSRGLLVTNVGKVDDGLAAFGDDIVSIRVIGPHIENVPAPAVVAFGFRGELHLEIVGAPSLAPEGVDLLASELLGALELGEGDVT